MGYSISKIILANESFFYNFTYPGDFVNGGLAYRFGIGKDDDGRHIFVPYVSQPPKNYLVDAMTVTDVPYTPYVLPVLSSTQFVDFERAGINESATFYEPSTGVTTKRPLAAWGISQEPDGKLSMWPLVVTGNFIQNAREMSTLVSIGPSVVGLSTIVTE